VIILRPAIWSKQRISEVVSKPQGSGTLNPFWVYIMEDLRTGQPAYVHQKVVIVKQFSRKQEQEKRQRHVMSLPFWRVIGGSKLVLELQLYHAALLHVLNGFDMLFTSSKSVIF